MDPVDDPVLLGMINKSVQLVNMSTRTKIYSQIYQYMSDKAYAPFLFVEASYTVHTKAVKGVVPIAGSNGQTAGGLIMAWENISD
jgi:ABC-type transport system substrate-binding protein